MWRATSQLSTQYLECVRPLESQGSCRIVEQGTGHRWHEEVPVGADAVGDAPLISRF